MVGVAQQRDRGLNVLRAGLCGIFAFAALSACRPVPDPELEVREQYIEKMIRAEDAGALWPLTSRSAVTFATGFSWLEFTQDQSLMWRWASKHAELRLRAPTAGRYHLHITGWGGGIAGFTQKVSVRVNGQMRKGFEGLYKYDADIEVGVSERPGTAFLVEFDCERSFTPPNDNRDLGFSINSLVWEPVP